MSSSLTEGCNCFTGRRPRCCILHLTICHISTRDISKIFQKIHIIKCFLNRWLYLQNNVTFSPLQQILLWPYNTIIARKLVTTVRWTLIVVVRLYYIPVVLTHMHNHWCIRITIEWVQKDSYYLGTTVLQEFMWFQDESHKILYWVNFQRV